MLSWEAFVSEGAALVRTDQWLWRHDPLEPHRAGFRYLVKENVPLVVEIPPTPSSSDDAQPEVEAEEEEGWSVKEVVDPSSLSAAATNTETHVYHYHILYSTTYRVPVLYFRAHRLDGEPLLQEEVWSDLLGPTVHPSNNQHHAEEKEDIHRDPRNTWWSLISQQEHPIEGSGLFFEVHPCQTSLVMAALFKKDPSSPSSSPDSKKSNYMVAWLSMVAPLMRLRVPPDCAAKKEREEGEERNKDNGEGDGDGKERARQEVIET
ncbi:E2-like conjugating enzyme atg10 [Balamuthia mandrillaris]